MTLTEFWCELRVEGDRLADAIQSKLTWSYSGKAAACLLWRRDSVRKPLLWLTYGAMDADPSEVVP